MKAWVADGGQVDLTALTSSNLQAVERGLDQDV